MTASTDDRLALAAGHDPQAVMQAAADIEADRIWQDTEGTWLGERAFGHVRIPGRRRSLTVRGQPPPPARVAMTAAGEPVTSAEVDAAVLELANRAGTYPYVIEERLAQLAGANPRSPASGRAMLSASDKIDLIAELTARLEEDDAATVALSAGAAAAPSPWRQGVESEVARLSGVAGGIALAQRRGHAPGHSAGQHHSVTPNLLGGSPPHEPFFGPHTHAHDHPSHAHDFEHIDHHHRHVHADGSPIGVFLVTGQPSESGAPAGLAAGYPGGSVAAQHHHPGEHIHEHHHGHDAGIPENSHAHHHAAVPAGYGIPGGLGYGDASSADLAAAEVARITGQNPHEGFTGGTVKGRSYVWTDPNQVTDTDHRQPSRGGVIHPAVAEVLARHRELFEPPGPLTELRQQRSSTPLGPLGHEGQAVARTRQARTNAEKPYRG